MNVEVAIAHVEPGSLHWLSGFSLCMLCLLVPSLALVQLHAAKKWRTR